jgi:dimethylamine/trimethylamine dehydrogenase
VRISTDELLSFKSDNHESEAHELFDLIGEVPDLWDIKLSEWTKECPSSRFAESGFMEPYNGFVKQLTSKPVVGVGWFTSPDNMVSQINRGILDFVGSARASIADPFLPNKIFEGNEDDIRECIGCNICASCYNQGIPVRCTQNPTMGEEWRRGWHPEKIKNKTSDENILIIGGGPAGLEAAMSLGKRGYEVTLAEKEKELGGRINKEIQLPGMSSYSRVKDYRTHQIDQLESVNVFLDNQMKVEDVIDMEFDHVVIASGSSWELTTIDDKAIPINTNENSNCLTPDDILNGAKVNGPVVIYDFDYYYMGGLIAEFLSGQGHTVNMVTPFENISPWSFMSNELNEIKLRLNEKNVTIHTDSRMLSSNNSSIEIINRFNKDQSSLEASTVVIVGTRKPRDKIYHELIKAKSSKIKSIIKIGDADAPGALYHAVYSGHLFAEYFGEEQPIDNMKHEYPMIQPF